MRLVLLASIQHVYSNTASCCFLFANLLVTASRLLVTIAMFSKLLIESRITCITKRMVHCLHATVSCPDTPQQCNNVQLVRKGGWMYMLMEIARAYTLGQCCIANVCMLPDGQREHSSRDALFGKWFLLVAAFPMPWVHMACIEKICCKKCSYLY